MEYAVIEIGGGQQKVKKGDIIKADLALSRTKKQLKIDKVLMYHMGEKVEIGNPYVKGISVTCDIIGDGKAEKIVVYKYKRRKSKKFKRGHRQRYYMLKIKDITKG